MAPGTVEASVFGDLIRNENVGWLWHAGFYQEQNGKIAVRERDRERVRKCWLASSSTVVGAETFGFNRHIRRP